VPAGSLSAHDYRLLGGFRAELRSFLAFSEDAARAHGLTPQQHQLMLAVRAASEAPTVGGLAGTLALRHHSTVGLIERLVRRGMVTKQRDPADRRAVRVALTKKGDRVLLELSLLHRDELRRQGPALVSSLRRMLRS
jgi:DNA-binding MarR family transcriptional regulator